MLYIEKYILENSIDEEEREIIGFGLERIKVAITSFVAIAATGLILGELIETLFLVICLLPLRQNAGGYHMKNKWACAICSCVVLVLSVICIKNIVIARSLTLVITVLSALLIFVFSPVGNPNNILDETEKRVYGSRARIICALELLLFFFLFIADRQIMCGLIMMAELITGILVVIGFVQEKINNTRGIENV